MSFEEEVKKYEELLAAQRRHLVKEEYKQYILDYIRQQDKPCYTTDIINNVFGKIMDIKSPNIASTNITIASANMNMLIEEGKVILLKNSSLILAEWEDRIAQYDKDIDEFFAKADGGAELLDMKPDIKALWASESPAKAIIFVYEQLEPLLEKVETFLDHGIEFFQRELRKSE